VKRAFAALILALMVAGAGAYLWSRSPAVPPLSHLVPSDALFYAGFADLESAERIARAVPAVESLLKNVDEARPHLAGEVALYVDREREWVLLARLRTVSAMLSKGEVEDGVAVVPQSPAALARRKARGAPLSADPRFRALSMPGYVDLEAFRLPGRLGDFSALGFEVDPGEPVVVRARALYRPEPYRIYLEHVVRGGGAGAPAAAPAAGVFTDHFPRVWDDFVASLSKAERERLEGQATVLSKEYLGGRKVRDFLGDVGPAWSVALVPTPHAFPALVGWVRVADPAARSALEKSLWRALTQRVGDSWKAGVAPPFDVAEDGPIRRVRFPGAIPLRLGEAFAPAYLFRDDLLVFSTCASVLDRAAPARGGAGHVTAAVEVASAADLIRSLTGLLADRTFLPEAGAAAAADLARLWPPSAVAAKRAEWLPRVGPQTADFEVARFLQAERSRLAAEHLARLAKTPAYEAELATWKDRIEEWAARLKPFKRLEATGNYTGTGFAFQVRGCRE
jgi:hypothetical protein